MALSLGSSTIQDQLIKLGSKNQVEGTGFGLAYSIDTLTAYILWGIVNVDVILNLRTFCLFLTPQLWRQKV